PRSSVTAPSPSPRMSTTTRMMKLSVRARPRWTAIFLSWRLEETPKVKGKTTVRKTTGSNRTGYLGPLNGPQTRIPRRSIRRGILVHHVVDADCAWSGWPDLNRRPLDPQKGEASKAACATGLGVRLVRLCWVSNARHKLP